jgi:hypothetical protein
MTPTTGSSWTAGRCWERAAGDPEQMVGAFESGHSSPRPATREQPFGFRRCCSRLTGSFEAGAVTGCRMAFGGSRPETDTEEFRPKRPLSLSGCMPST